MPVCVKDAVKTYIRAPSTGLEIRNVFFFQMFLTFKF